VTGGVSFLTGRTFHQLLHGAREPAWVAAFALRTTSYRRIADALAGHGLVTEVDAVRSVAQRRFTGTEEQRYAIAAVTARGGDPPVRKARAASTRHFSCPGHRTT